MALSASDERDLLGPLFEGVLEQPLWESFLQRLLARTRATQVCLLVRTAQMGALPPARRTVRATGGTTREVDPFALPRLAPYAALRPGRVYALEDLLEPESGRRARDQRQGLARAGVAQARYIHILAKGDHHAWLALVQSDSDLVRGELGGGDSALLSALAAPFASALANFAAMEALRLRLAMAEQALDLLAVRQFALDRDGKPIPSAGAPPLPPAPSIGRSIDLAEASASLADRPPTERRVVELAEGPGKAMLLRPLPPQATVLPTSAVSIGAIHGPPRANAASAAPVLARELGLSAREAALADAMARGTPLVEAGKALQLTAETTRNYSKRIYAKTGASGQADLVRMVLTGLAPLA